MIRGNSVDVFHHGDTNGFPDRLRLTRSAGSSWTVEAAALASTTFDVIKTFTNVMTANFVGVYGGTAGNSPPAYLVSVDYVEFDSDPVDDTDTPLTVVPSIRDTIEVWSGLTMNYGANGLGQDWLNIVGRAPVGTTSMTYELSSNCGAVFPRTTADSCGLLLGADGKRLVDSLDFNLEIYVEDLLECSTGGIFFVDFTVQGAYPQTEQVTIYFSTPSVLADRSFTVDWSTPDLNDYGQVVDGHWEVDTVKGVERTKQIGYDRLMTIGDRDWLANYEVYTTFKLYTSSIQGIGFAMGWRGHKGKVEGTCSADGPLQTTWPLETITWIWQNRDLEIWTYPHRQAERSLSSIACMGSELVVGQLYHIRSSIQPLENGSKNLVKTKIWKEGQAEPAWLLEATPYAINPDTNGTGSILLLCHHTDVEFGPVVVTPHSSNIFQR